MDVLDEPLYANFLRVTGVDRPYRQELLSKMVRLEPCLSCLQLEGVRCVAINDLLLLFTECHSELMIYVSIQIRSIDPESGFG